MIQDKDIVIFGKNSIIAKKFSDSYKNTNNHLIFLTRNKSLRNDIVCSLDKKISSDSLNKICYQIIDLYKFKNKVFILFAWSGRPRTNSLKNASWANNKNIVRNFLDIAEKLLPSKIIFISSTSVYAENKNIYFSESDEPFPNSDYSKQKLIAEKQIENFANKNNIDFTILRISSAYGFDNRFSEQGVINKWLYDILKHREIKLLNSKDSKINFISFDQITKAISFSIKKPLIGTYNIGSEESISLEKIIQEIERLTKKSFVINSINDKKRTININTNKFFFATGIRFKNEVINNIELIYTSIIKELS